MLWITYVTQNKDGTFEYAGKMPADFVSLYTEPTLQPQFFRVECSACGQVHRNIQEALDCRENSQKHDTRQQ